MGAVTQACIKYEKDHGFGGVIIWSNPPQKVGSLGSVGNGLCGIILQIAFPSRPLNFIIIFFRGIIVKVWTCFLRESRDLFMSLCLFSRVDLPLQ